MSLTELILVVIGLGVSWIVGIVLCDIANNLGGTDPKKNHEIDFRQAVIDSSTGKCNGKELKRRMNSGYYNKDKK